MKQLRQAAARERRAPILWWFLMTLTMGGGICLFIWSHSHDAAVFAAILFAAVWVAPLFAFMSLAAPHRAKAPPPARGEGTYDEWLKQARLLGRVLLYYGDNPAIPGELRHAFHDARMDLHDTLKAHPLRDDLERVCQRIREGAIKEMKNWFAGEYRRDIRELANEYEQAASAGMDPDKRLLALQDAVEK
ncbi:MAG: hypothetical protein KAI66_22895, partial [Lentisphaeria bacterium]|nr:hypothetical protein [Lentisphaeria bacterium]